MSDIITVNNSEGKPNWSQIKNKYEPLSTCNVAACINAAQSAGEDVLTARCMGEDRPADDLYKFIKLDGACQNLWRSLDPEEDYPPNQWMAVLALGLGRWLGYGRALRFDENSNPNVMAQWIIAGGTCVVSGHYPCVHADGREYPIDHITALVGIKYRLTEAGIEIVDWLMDDSYGDYRTQYKSRFGDNVEMSPEDFQEYLKKTGHGPKRCLFVPKKGAKV